MSGTSAGSGSGVYPELVWVAQGRLTPVVSERIGLEDAVQGLQRLARREVRGKVVVMFKDTGLPAR